MFCDESSPGGCAGAHAERERPSVSAGAPPFLQRDKWICERQQYPPTISKIMVYPCGKKVTLVIFFIQTMKRNYASREVVGKTNLYIYTLKVLATVKRPATGDTGRRAILGAERSLAPPASLASDNTGSDRYE